MKQKTLPKFVIAFVAVIAFSSCNDAKLARDIDGSWECGTSFTHADGTKGEEKQILSFSYVESDEKDGGTYTEKRNGKFVMEDDGQSIAAEYTITIDGEYEILAGDLYVTYDVSTLNVSIDKLKTGLSDDATLQDLTDMFASFSDFSFVTDYVAMKREIKKSVYHDCFIDYKTSNNDGTGFLNVEIEDDKLSFDTSDIGRMTYYRTK